MTARDDERFAAASINDRAGAKRAIIAILDPESNTRIHQRHKLRIDGPAGSALGCRRSDWRQRVHGHLHAGMGLRRARRLVASHRIVARELVASALEHGLEP